MLCYASMIWDLKGMSYDELWDLEAKEAATGIQTLESGYVSHLYKVVAQRKVVAYANVPHLEDLDRTAFGRLPMHEHLIFDEVWALEEGFTRADVPGYLRERRARLDTEPRCLFSVGIDWDPAGRRLDGQWETVVQALRGFDRGIPLGVYRVAGRQRVIALVDVVDASDLSALARLPALEGARVGEVMGLRDYVLFADDVSKHFRNV